jgi:hypothetical protein
MKGKSVKRRIDLGLLAGVTKSLTSNEFVLHCPNEYDYRFAVAEKNAIIQVLIQLYQ